MGDSARGLLGKIALVFFWLTWALIAIPLGISWAISFNASFEPPIRTTVPVFGPIELAVSTAIYLLIAACVLALSIAPARRKRLALVTAAVVVLEGVFPFAMKAYWGKQDEKAQKKARAQLDGYLGHVARGELDEAWAAWLPERQQKFPLEKFKAFWTAKLGDPRKLTWTHRETVADHAQEFAICSVAASAGGEGTKTLELCYCVKRDGRIESCTTNGDETDPW
jgi:hypothetical protein